MTSGSAYQRGASIWLILLMVIVLGFAVVCGLKVIPMYLESYKIDKAMEGVLQDGAGSQTPRDIQLAMVRRLDIDDVKAIPSSEFKKYVTITKKGNSVTIEVDYEQEVHLFGNLWAVARFEKVRTN